MASPPASTPAELEKAESDESAPTSTHNGPGQSMEVELKDGKKKKKRNNRPKKKATGFEEYYCEGPINPAEHQEERTVLYPPHRPFVDRIEECIQRYRARRRLDSRRELMFSRYLMLGGVDATVRQFQGTKDIGADVLENATKADVREMTADDVIQRGGKQDSRFYNPNFPDHWDVDFAGVVSGYLSEHLRGLTIQEYWVGIDVVHNFLKYVVQHDVCPEYADDLTAAQKVCLQAVKEVPDIEQLLELVPGDFNTAMGFLHCKKDEAGDLNYDNFNKMPDLDPKHAQMTQAVTMSVSGVVPEPGKPPVEWPLTKTVEHTFEVLSITLPDAVAKAKYKSVNQHLTDYLEIQPCGTMTARPIIIRDGWDNAMTATIPPEDDVQSSFFLEEDILKLLTVGMKLTMTVCTLGNGGYQFIKHVKDIKPSFYVFLPQELMIKYKEPVLSERPGPSIHDNNGDEEGAGNDE